MISPVLFQSSGGRISTTGPFRNKLAKHDVGAFDHQLFKSIISWSI
jgi:hypothetical protein